MGSVHGAEHGVPRSGVGGGASSHIQGRNEMRENHRGKQGGKEDREPQGLNGSMVLALHNDILNEQQGLTASSGCRRITYLHGSTCFRGDLHVGRISGAWTWPEIMVQAGNSDWAVGTSGAPRCGGVRRSALLCTVSPRKCLRGTSNTNPRLGIYSRPSSN
jgi:hypothetical protein